MKANVEKFLRFFGCFGLYFEVQNTSKWDKIFLKISNIAWCLIVASIPLISIIFVIASFHLWTLSSFLPLLFFFIMRFSAFFILIITRWNREREQKVLRNLTEIDELIEDFLGIKIDYRKVKRESFWKISIQLAIFITGTLFNSRGKLSVDEFKDYMAMAAWTFLVVRVYMMKYAFYVDILNHQLEVRKNFYKNSKNF